MENEKELQAAGSGTLYDEEEDIQEGMYLTFPLGKEEYGIEIRHVTEIVGIQSITEIPNMPSYVKGVINLRGKVIPVMDVRLRFNLEEQDYHDRTCIVVVKIEDVSVGLVVDTVSEVTNIPADQVEPPPSINQGDEGKFIKGMGKCGDKVKILLDAQRLLFSGGFAEAAQAS